VPLAALSWHRYAQAELDAWAAMPVSRQIVSSSYVSSNGTRYHLHQELVTDENSCWLCSSCTGAKNHVSQFCVREVDYGWLRRGYQHTPSLLEECIVRRSRPYSYSIKCSDASSAGLKLKSHVVCVQQAVRMAVTFVHCANNDPFARFLMSSSTAGPHSQTVCPMPSACFFRGRSIFSLVPTQYRH